MKRWLSNFMAGLLFFTAFFMFIPKFFWDLGRKKWSLFVLLVEVSITVAVIWFIVAAFQAIFN